MRGLVQSIVLGCLVVQGAVFAESMRLVAPVERQVIQRSSKERGTIDIGGSLDEEIQAGTRFEARLTIGGVQGEWDRVEAVWDEQVFRASMDGPAGGWHSLEVRALVEGEPVAMAKVDRFGIGEVFVVAGQSNSANHGEEKQKPKTDKVISFAGDLRWQVANDPQPGASGGRGSFIPPLGDALVDKFEVPVAFVACGIGATSVREWLPKGTRFPNPPTIERRVRRVDNGEWESKGEAYDAFIERLRWIGKGGCRAVLWHQGESDANQRDASRTLSGDLYRKYLEQLIRQSGEDRGWEVPWFVAQVSYHVPGDEGSPDIRAAQASLWKDGLALEGPDSDAIKGKFRERDGKGVHFSGPGLREHAKRWFEKVAPWLEKELE